jgi:hypothetical protein
MFKFGVGYDEDVSPVIFVHVLLFNDDCHCMVPVFPVRDSVVAFPGQKVVAIADAVPAIEVGLTVTVIATLGPSQPDALTCAT